MRFETEVLTLEDFCGYGCCNTFVSQDSDEPDNDACWDEIAGSGWIVPDSYDSRIVLVFSTTRVTGASRCHGHYLSFAGKIAMKKAGLNHLSLLWWWPEIVTGGE